MLIDFHKLPVCLMDASFFLCCMLVFTESGVRHAFNVRVPLNISDIDFYPSQRFHEFDLFASVMDNDSTVFVDLHSGMCCSGKSVSLKA